ncbi:hypothetical protein NBRC10512_000108 [Rhodotorula toruloides]|uniref:RHTO0S09e06238g1_1 n=2 Tax=Rhodotorula toruloides TaxID=5286 RepID=A0A061B517_RHOTO|nr:Rho GTPase-activating protein [Rhodotorula toruloides NP11]EMS19933.1 Rho GTPase-activating protein [Rhodotorula toruloides NP11]CDR44558.1 RHTO0S09e06238g1_1 [Rhodotorula toruloides]
MQTIPLYLASAPRPSTSSDNHSETSFPEPPSRLSVKHPTPRASSKRHSFRPPIPPKPASVRRSSEEEAGSDPASEAGPQERKDSIAKWMTAMTEREDGQRAGTPGSNRSREPPSIPPRPVLVSSPAPPQPSSAGAASTSIYDAATPSSGPPSLSPFSAMSSSQFPSPSSPEPAMFTVSRPTPSNSPERSRHRPPQHPSISSAASITSSTSSMSLNPSSALSAIGRGFQQAKLKDRFGAGVGFAREWGGKGKGKLQESWRGFGGPRSPGESCSPSTSPPISASSSPVPSFGSLSSSVSTPHLEHLSAPSPLYPSPSPPPGGTSIKLPTTLFGIRVPNARGLAFGRPLAPLVEFTRSPPSLSSLPRTRSADDEVTGLDARYWLPGLAYRCLEYLEEWGKKEEGVYRIPGRSLHTQQLRAVFDAGVGQEVDLREIHPGDLDPHAVASVLKSWLREIPEPLLSHDLEPVVDALTTSALGYPASSTNFLSNAASASSTTPSTLPSTNGVVSGTSAATAAFSADTRAPHSYLEHLSTLFSTSLPAENYHLLRAIAYHLAHLSAHSETNKMTLTNLRLILSPTLRLSPGFLQVLVVEREILFSKANESARSRQASASGHHSPTLSSSASFRTRSPSPQYPVRRSPTPGTSSPLLEPPSPSFPAAPSSDGHLSPIVTPTFAAFDFPPPSPSQIPLSSPTQPATTPNSTATPIAAKFAGTSPPLRTTKSASNLLSPSAPTAQKPAFVPSRDRANGAGGGGFFASRDAVVPPREGSATSLGLGIVATKTDEEESREKKQDGRLSLGEEFRQAIDSLGKPLTPETEKKVGEEFEARLGGEKEPVERLVDQREMRSRPARPSHRTQRSVSSIRSFASSLASSITSSSLSTLANNASETDLKSAQVQQASRRKGPPPALGTKQRPTTMDLTLPMPSGIGIGLGLASPREGKERDEEQKWTLSSFDEKKKLFGG